MDGRDDPSSSAGGAAAGAVWGAAVCGGAVWGGAVCVAVVCGEICAAEGVVCVSVTAELSAEIGKAKVKNCVESGASAVVTDCPGCTMQIRGVAEACGQSLRVEHMAELLARTLKLH